MPILANVLLRTDGKGKLLLAATDLNVSVSAELAVKVEKEGGLTVSAKPLHEIIANLPGEDVVFKRAENNWADIKAAKVAYKLVGMPDRDFPKMPDHREAKYGKVDPVIAARDDRQDAVLGLQRRDALPPERRLLRV